MMLYQNRVFVATTDVYDIADGGGFNTVEGQIPRVFAPAGATVHNEPVTRMGVLGVFSMQKAVHHWFTTDRTIEVSEGGWIQALPPLPPYELDVVTFIILETATSTYAAILTRSEKRLAEVISVPEETASTSDGPVEYVMQLIKVLDGAMLFTDSLMVLGTQFSSFELQGALCSLPIAITGQMILHMYNALDKLGLYKWEATDTDTRGVSEIPIDFCSPAQINGYALFIRIPAPADSKLLN